MIAEDALARAAEHAAAAPWAGALVVADANTWEAAGEQLADELRGTHVPHRSLVLRADGHLSADPAHSERVAQALPADWTPVAVGSGVITDIVRWAAHLRDTGFVSVPTAASMDGYASSMAAMQVQGVKVTWPARSPQAIFADPDLIAAAPAELTRAGLGDLLGKATARVDWLAAHLLYGEGLHRRAADAVLEPLAVAAREAAAILAGEPAAIRALIEGLIQSGLAMALAGSSRPASGCEHHASHFWDLLAARARRAHHPHGLQVGYATRFAIRLADIAFGPGAPAPGPPQPPPAELNRHERAWLGEPTAELAGAVAGKRRFVQQGSAEWDAARWAEVQAELAPALELCAAADAALAPAGFPLEPGWLEVDEVTLRATFPLATRLRARYTTVDFLEGQGRLPEAVRALFVSG